MRTGGGFPDVVVTALASMTTLAPDAEGTWQRLLMGESGIRPLTKAFVEKYNAPAVPSTLTCMSFLSSFHHPFATIANPIGPAADYRAVLIHGSDIALPGDTFSNGPQAANPNGVPGVETLYASNRGASIVDPLPAQFVTEVAQKQDTAIRNGLPQLH